MNNLANFPSFQVNTNKQSQTKKKLFVEMKVTDGDQKRALLLHYAGEKVYDIYNVEKREMEATFKATLTLLNDYFAPKKNVQMENYNFRSCKQNDTLIG